jgi:uncharacterized membrane protein
VAAATTRTAIRRLKSGAGGAEDLQPAALSARRPLPSIAGLNAEHHSNATHHQRAVDRITSLLGRASFMATLTAFVVGWMSLNCFALALAIARPTRLPSHGWREDRR